MKRIVLGLLLSLIPLPALAFVNINTATLSELDTLPGVGAVIAQKIIDSRPFASTSEIQNVQGIGSPGTKTYDAIIGLITVDGTTLSDAEDSSTAKSSAVKKDDEIKIQKPVSGLVLNGPDYAFVGQVVNFEATPSDGDQDRLVRYWWNFGDGDTADSKMTTHQYRYPGTYVVVAESYYLKKTHIARQEITILSPQLSVHSDQNSFVITNESDHEIDLSGMTLSGIIDWNFPKHSILLPKASLAVDTAAVGNALATRLLGADGKVVAVSDEETMVAKPKSVAYSPIPRISAVSTNVSSQVIDQSPTFPEVDKEVGSNASIGEPTQTASLSNANIPAESWPYLGLVVVISLGLFAVWKGNARL